MPVKLGAPAEPEADSQRRKGGIKQTLKPVQSAPLALLDQCVLQTMPPHLPQDPRVRASVLQRAYRSQYCRAIDADPEKRLSYTYNLNCRPVGFDVTPATQACCNPRVCPWCFVRRRLVPIYAALESLPPRLWPHCKIAVWRRSVPFPADKLPFFPSGYGPHRWCKAAVTTQAVIPFIAPFSSRLELNHVGIQLVPKTLDVRAALTRRCIAPQLTVWRYDHVSLLNILRAMALVVRIRWADLYAEHNLQHFTTLIDALPNQRLLRISRYKSAGDALVSD